MSVITYQDGRRVSRQARSRRERFTVHEADHGVALHDHDSHLLYVTERRGFDLAAWLNALNPTSDQLGAFLGEGEHRRFLRRLGLGTTRSLQHDGVCWRCGRPMRAGMPAFWHRESKLIRHVRACPKPATAKLRRAT